RPVQPGAAGQPGPTRRHGTEFVPAIGPGATVAAASNSVRIRAHAPIERIFDSFRIGPITVRFGKAFLPKSTCPTFSRGKDMVFG
ncbi:MAG: hypothetical protein JWN70_6240, partial [Planctomycetaceae bacterium]|nr:hypothetical protein [Planctomycetaceae bacterium]